MDCGFGVGGASPKRCWTTLLATTIVLAAGSLPCDAHAQLTTTAAELEQWGEEALAVIDRELWIADRGLYAERATRGRRRLESLEPAFMWGCGVQVTALAAASRIAPEAHAQRLADYIKSLDSYWKSANGVDGYDVLPAPAKSDRYYDDNAWMVLALIEAYEFNHDKALLDRADATATYVLSGEDDQLGGGIYWRERRKNSKNTCSNAPAVAGLLRLQAHRNRGDLLASAQRIHAWTIGKLQDDADGLMWDNVRLDGRLDRRKYSYNTALVIRSCCLFHQVTGEEKWLAEARRLARAAEAHWIVPETGGIKDGGRFAHLLLEAFLAVHGEDHDEHWLTVVDRSLRYVHDELRDAGGRYPNRWDERRDGGRNGLALIDQASAARAFFVAADAWRKRSPESEPASH